MVSGLRSVSGRFRWGSDVLATLAYITLMVAFFVILGVGTETDDRHHETETSALGELGRAVARGVRTLDRLSSVRSAAHRPADQLRDPGVDVVAEPEPERVSQCREHPGELDCCGGVEASADDRPLYRHTSIVRSVAGAQGRWPGAHPSSASASASPRHPVPGAFRVTTEPVRA